MGRWWYLWQILREKCAVWYLHNRLPHFRGNFVGCAWNTKYFLYKPRRVLLAPNPSHLASKYLFVYCHFPTCLGPKKLCIKYMSRGKRSPQNQWESQPLSTFKITKDLDFVWSIFKCHFFTRKTSPYVTIDYFVIYGLKNSDESLRYF